MSNTTSSIKTFARNWTLPISMISGALAYFIWISIPGHESWNPFAAKAIAWIQPSLIFIMLFVSFCKVRISEFTLKWWHLWLALFQLGSFVALAVVASHINNYDIKVVIESAMLCLICPTATAAAVITGKLGGSQASIVSYTMIINIIAAISIPVVLPHVHLHEGLTFWPALLTILMKVFPLLICPLFLACIVRHYTPRLHSWILSFPNFAFYLWAVALALAIAVTAKSLHHTTVDIWCQIGIAAVSLITCLGQFAYGKHFGGRAGERISGGQACGQKNTVLAIWLGYTFMDPVTALAGGFYSVWHNIINSYQLYKMRNKH